jgi:predicted Zn-dependent protease
LNGSWQRKLVVSSGYLELGMLEEAARTLSEVEPEDRRRKEVLGAQLDLCIAAEQWDRAIATAASLVKSEPEDAVAWLALARLIMKTPNPEYAEDVLIKARKWHPKIAFLIMDFAREATAIGCLKEAKVWLRCGIHLQEGVRSIALQDRDFKPLWSWLKTAP